LYSQNQIKSLSIYAGPLTIKSGPSVAKSIILGLALLWTFMIVLMSGDEE